MNLKEYQAIMKVLVTDIKNQSFVADYTATDEEAIGLLLTKYFEWNGTKVLKACAYALEDANYHTECQKVLELIKE